VKAEAKHYTSNAYNPDPDPHWVKETLVEELCDTQREGGYLPTPVDNEQFILDILDKSDRLPKPKATNTAPRKGKDAKSIIENDEQFPCKLLRGNEVKRPLPRSLSPLDRLMQRRFKMLMRIPEWAARCRAASCLGVMTPESHGGGPQVYAKLAQAILDDSNKVFGDWTKEPARKILFT